jgi:hypothetical protein
MVDTPGPYESDGVGRRIGDAVDFSFFFFAYRFKVDSTRRADKSDAWVLKVIGDA